VTKPKRKVYKPVATVAELTEMPNTMEELMALSKKAKTEVKQQFYADLIAELDRVMPEVPDWGSRHWYECLICGGLVKNRVAHLRWHRGTDMIDILVSLFGRPN
jgi:hypothetical protein